MDYMTNNYPEVDGDDVVRRVVTAVVSTLVAAAVVAILNRLWDRRRRKGAFVPD